MLLFSQLHAIRKGDKSMADNMHSLWHQMTDSYFASLGKRITSLSLFPHLENGKENMLLMGLL